MVSISGFGSLVFGLAASVSWGAGDFGGGIATRRANVFGVAFTTYGTGLALLVALALIAGEPTPYAADMLWAGASGLVGVVGLMAFYRALAVGQMGIVAPFTAVIAAAIPVLAGLLTEGLPGAYQITGFGFAFVSVILIANPQSTTGHPTGLGLGLLAAVSFSGFFIFLAQVSDHTVWWSLVMARASSTGVALVVALLSQRNWLPPGRMLPLLLMTGILDVGGNTFFLLATHAGRLDIATVLSSLYPAVTLLLARAILKEQLSRIQAVGIVAALIAIALIAL
ncbi:MAG: DMT family transporter [Anaerolineae bacterium]|nr:DMT family transporter [Anaerolineae bacterium]